MIKEKVKLVKSVTKFVTRVCDECGKEEKARMAVVLRGRRARGKEIDLCLKCASSRKYKPLGSWPQNEKSHLWKGGRRKHEAGIRIHLSPGKWIYEHRLMMGEYLGRELLIHEPVHHINLCKYDNDINNLYLCKNTTEHGLIHNNLEILGYQLLGNKIWFDYDKKEYVSYETKVPEDKKINIEIDIDYNIHIMKSKGKTGLVKYRQVYNKPIGNGKYEKKYIHIEIMKKIIGRDFYRNEVIHHIDGDSSNNLNRNLILMINKNHISCHRQLQNRVIEFMECGFVKFDEGVYYV